MAPKSKTVVVIMGGPQKKKTVTRYDSLAAETALGNAYISNEALKKLGNPEEIKVTIEAA